MNSYSDEPSETRKRVVDSVHRERNRVQIIGGPASSIEVWQLLSGGPVEPVKSKIFGPDGLYGPALRNR